MRIKYLKINNLRCIDEFEIDVYDFTSLIGPNNAGKSTLLRALQLFLQNGKPEPDEWRQGHESEDIVVEVHFDELKDWERNTSGVAGIVNQDEIKLRYVLSLVDNKVINSYFAFVREIEIDGWSSKWGELPDEYKELAQNIGIENGRAFTSVASKELLRQEVINSFPDRCNEVAENWTTESISIPAALQQALPQVVFIPAVRDAGDETKTTNTTSFGALLNSLILPALEQSDEYKELEGALSSLSSKLTEGENQIVEVQNVTEQISSRISSIIEASIRLSISAPDTSKLIGSNTKILVNDGIETPIAFQGHGVQRALIFGLIEVIAKMKAAQNREGENCRASLLLFEEPELYLHPHLMRRFKRALEQISQNDQWQVIISTHSPFLIDVVDNPKSLAILNRPDRNSPPILNQLKSDPFADDESKDLKMALRASLDFHPTVCEAFFANRVVLVEGDTELSILNHDSNPHVLFGVSQEMHDMTTVVSCGGKWTIPAMARLLSAFSLPFRIMHDLDRKGLTDEELEELSPLHPFKANAKIESEANGAEILLIQDTMEHVLWDPNIPVSSKEKPFKAWQRIKSLIENNEEVFDMEQLGIIFNFVFNW